MVEYTIETLVHLYDDINKELEKIQKDLTEYTKEISKANTSDAAILEYELYKKSTTKRTDKLIQIRTDLEDIFYKTMFNIAREA